MLSQSKVWVERRKIAKVIYDDLVNFAKTGHYPDKESIYTILASEFELWSQLPEWMELQNSGVARAVINTHSLVPLPENWLRDHELVQRLYLGQKPIARFLSSGTTSAHRGLSLLDAVAFTLLSATTSAGFTILLREQGYSKYCEQLEYPDFSEAVTYYEKSANPVLFIPKSKSEKPFQACLAGFPSPYGCKTYENFPANTSFVTYGTQQLAEMSSDHVVYTVELTPEIPFKPRFDLIINELQERTENLPVLFELPTPVHPLINQLMHQGKLPDLLSGDMMWSAGGDKAKRGLIRPEGLETRSEKIVNYNLLGNTHDSTQWYSRPATPLQMHTDAWAQFVDHGLYTLIFSYDTDLVGQLACVVP